MANDEPVALARACFASHSTATPDLDLDLDLDPDPDPDLDLDPALLSVDASRTLPLGSRPAARMRGGEPTRS